jgi:hypothetical protein
MISTCTKDKTVQILMQKHFALGSEARLEEQSILKKKIQR